MVNKGVIRRVSLLLVVGLVIGAVVAVVHITNSKSGSVSLSRQMKLVTPPPALSPVAEDSSILFKNNLKAALLTALDKSKKALKITKSLSLDTTTGKGMRSCLQECKGMVKTSIESAQNTFLDVSNGDMHNMDDNSLLDLKIRISGVITDIVMCLDIMEPEIDRQPYEINTKPPPAAHDVKVYRIMQSHIRQVSAAVNKALGIVNNNMKVPGL